MNTPDWIARSVSILRSPEKSESKKAPAQAERAQAATKSGATSTAVRSTRERLAATLRQKEEALSPRVLRRTLEELKAIVDPQVSEVEGGRRAMGVAGWYANASPDERRDMWLLMSEQFVADA